MGAKPKDCARVWIVEGNYGNGWWPAVGVPPGVTRQHAQNEIDHLRSVGAKDRFRIRVYTPAT